MEWQKIVGFYNVAKLGSFTKGGEATFRTQSAISQQIKALENELCWRLFERISGRKLRLTFAGERLLRFAETVLAEYDQLIDELKAIEGLQDGPLTISAPFNVLHYLLPSKIEKYIKKHPHVELTVLDRAPQTIVDLVKNGDVDFGIALESICPKNLEIYRWKKMERVLVTPLGHPLSHVPVMSITLREIARYPLILPPKNLKYTARALLEKKFEELGIDYRIIMEASTFDLASNYVEMGLGILFAILATNLPALKKRKLEFISLPHLFQPEYLAVIMREDKALPAYKRDYIDILLNEKDASETL